MLTEKARGFQSVAMGIWVKGGSRHESKKEAGYAHFIEHMIFKGTKNYSALDIARFTDEIGGEFNAMTSREYTCFHLNLPRRSIKKGIALVCDILLNAQFEEAEVERERNVILHEMAMVDDSAEELIFEQLLAQCYPNHPIGRPILGNKESIAKITGKSLTAYFRRHYSIDNMVITIAGNVDHQMVKEQFIKALPAKAKHKKSFSKESLKKPKYRSACLAVKRKNELCHLMLAFEGIAIGDKNRFPLFLLNAFLGGGMSSRLFQSIREENGLAYSVYSSIPSFHDCGLATLYVATEKKAVPLCLSLIKQEIARLQAEPINNSDLETIKNSIKNAVLMDSDSMESRMFALARSAVFAQKFLTNQEVCAAIDKISAKQMHVLAQKIFSGKPTLVALGNISTRELQVTFKRLAK